MTPLRWTAPTCAPAPPGTRAPTVRWTLTSARTRGRPANMAALASTRPAPSSATVRWALPAPAVRLTSTSATPIPARMKAPAWMNVAPIDASACLVSSSTFF